MSKYSGKCDLYDILAIYDVLVDTDKFADNAMDTLRNWTIRVGCHGETLKIKSVKDIVPYFPFVETSGGYGNGKANITLMEKSWVDVSADRHYGLMAEYLTKKARYAKRKGLDPVEYMMDCGYLTDSEKNEQGIPEFVVRIAVDGKKADWSGLVPGFGKYMRDELYDTMVNFGYSPAEAGKWCYHGRRTWK